MLKLLLIVLREIRKRDIVGKKFFRSFSIFELNYLFMMSQPYDFFGFRLIKFITLVLMGSNWGLIHNGTNE